MAELWKPVVGFEGLYEVSNSGEVRHKNGCNVKQCVNKKKYTNYRYVNLRKDGKNVRASVHRIVAEAFLENPFDKEDVNHIDGNKENNCVENLEWATRSENNYHKCRVLGKKPPNIPTPLKPVKCVETGEVFESRSEAARKHKTQPVHINECCEGRRKTAGGFHWESMPLPEPPEVEV